MPATALIDRDVLLHLQLGDEQALERLFRTSYPMLADRARSELDDPAGAPRLVEGAFLRAWHERAQFDTPESLERFLQRSVHEGAVREKSRRASLHRFEVREGVKAHAPASPIAPLADQRADTLVMDAAWEHVSAVLHAPPADAEHAANVRHDHSRHEAAQHMVAVVRRPPWIWPAVTAVVLAALMLVGARWMDRSSTDVAVTRALAAPDVRTRITRPGERATLTLTDGSRAMLGGDSKLNIPPTFGDVVRAVGLEGAASFTVHPAADRPFIVRTGQVTVTATGTAFDVRSFAGEGGTLVRVRSGSVEVRAGEQLHTIAAGQTMALRADGTMQPLDARATTERFAWADGRLVIRDRPLQEALGEVRRWTGLTLETKDPAVLARPVSVDVELGATRALIAALEKTGKVTFGYEGTHMVLRDAP